MRKAAAEASSDTLKERLLALATLYETKSMAAAARQHRVSVTQLTSWRDLLSEGGVHALAFKGKESYRPTPDEIEAAVQNATSEADRSLLRAAGAVFSGTRSQDAAAEWNVQPLTLAAFVAKVTKGDATSLVLDPVSIKVRRSARQLRAMAKRADPKTVLVLEALARIAEGTPLREVVGETITVDLLRRTEARLGAGDQPPISSVTEQSGDEALLQQLEKWTSPRRDPFLMTIRWLMIHRLSQREGFEQALASNGIPNDAFDIWFDRARRNGFSSVVALSSAGTPPSLIGLPKVSQVEEPRFPCNMHRQILGLIAYSNGASIKTGATIANIPPGEFFQLVSAYKEDGLDAFDRIRLGQRHTIVAGLKEWRARHDEPFPRKIADLLIASFSDDPNFSDLLTVNGFDATAVEKWQQLIRNGGAFSLDTLVSPLTADLPARHSSADIKAMVPYLKTDLVRRKSSALIALYEGASPVGAADASSLEEAEVLALLADLKKYDLATVLGFAKVRPVFRRTITPHSPAMPQQAVAARGDTPAPSDGDRPKEIDPLATQESTATVPEEVPTEAKGKSTRTDERAGAKATRQTKTSSDLEGARQRVRRNEERSAVETQGPKRKAADDGKRRQQEADDNSGLERRAAKTKKRPERIAIAKQPDLDKALLAEQKPAKAKSAGEVRAPSKAQSQRAKARASVHAHTGKAHSGPEASGTRATKVKPTPKAAAMPTPPQAKRPSRVRIHLRGDYNVARIDEMLRSASASTVIKLKMLRRAYEGDDLDDIAATLHLQPALVGNWINIFNSDGLIGLMLASKRLPN
ncbi:hypothetical protein [Rhizobium sp. BK176]|uniref:hypothetical protein n=1 Tax=Rhizobium sp. BK176 TaxID=2587071 RepID=UPI002168BCA2|nr:hypothetical protein [Rhizobium sp. BK176]MCS4088572.1 transposase-like protein [Rhizobium sp. BK176]